MTPSALRLLWLAGQRQLWRQPLLALLAVAGVALGVAAVTGVELAARGAMHSFRTTSEALFGQATHQILAPPGGLPESLQVRLKTELGLPYAAPVVESHLHHPGHPGQLFTLLGVDPLAEGGFRLPRATGLALLADLMTQPDAVLLTARTARTLGLAPGDHFTLTLAGRPLSLRVAGVQADDPDHPQPEGLLFMDLAAAQELTGGYGRLSRIDLQLPEEAGGEALARRIRPLLPAGASLVAVGRRIQGWQELTHAFRQNLAALSVMAMMVGALLVHNVVHFTTLRRRPLLGLLRAQGVTPRQLFWWMMGDIATLALPGVVLGALLGVALGRGLTTLVARTVNDLYFAVTAAPPPLDLPLLLTAALAGLATALLAGAAPVVTACRQPIAAAWISSDTAENSARLHRRLAWAGLVLALAALAALHLPGATVSWAMVAVAALMAGYGCWIPWLGWHITRGLAAHPNPGMMARLALAGAANRLPAMRMALVSLTLAVAVTLAMDLMIRNFRYTVVDWLALTLQADLYLSVPAALADSPENLLDPAMAHTLAALPGVTSMGMGRNLVLEDAHGMTRILALEIPRHRFRGFQILAALPGDLWQAFSHHQALLITEPLARKRRLAPGDRLSLPAAGTPLALPVAAVVRDFGSDAGLVIMSRATFLAHWQDDKISTISLELAPEQTAATLIPLLRHQSGADRPLLIRSNRELRERSVLVFDRTFAVTGVLRWIILTIACLGMATALLALQWARRREIAVLRTLGLTPRRILALILGETALMGTLSGLLALPLGATLGWMLTGVVNPRAFGWTLSWRWEAAPLLTTLLTAILAATLTGLAVARHLMNTPPAEALRGDDQVNANS